MDASSPLPATSVEPRAESWFELPPQQVYKQDGRSHVWRVDGPGDTPWVVKRYEGPAWRQKLLWRGGRHPAQREVIWTRRLAEMGLPVVDVRDHGFTGGRAWIVTPWRGDTLHMWVRKRRLIDDLPARHTIARQLGGVLGRLTHARVLHRDSKAANFVIDEDRTLRLIDVGGCRGAKGIPILHIALRMLTTLQASVAISAQKADHAAAAVTRTDRMRCYRQMLQAWDRFPDGLQHLPRNVEFAALRNRSRR